MAPQWFSINLQPAAASGRIGRTGYVGIRSVDLTLRLGMPREEQVQNLPSAAQFVNQPPNPMAPHQDNLNSAGPYSQYNGTVKHGAENGGSILPSMNTAAAGFGGFTGPVLGVPAYNSVPPRQLSPEPPSTAQTNYILLDVPARRARCSKRGHNQPRTYTYYNPYRRCSNYNCDTDDTPMWRRGPLGPKTLCNACGIKYRKEQKKEAAARN